MIKTTNIFKLLKMLMMAGLVVFLLTACKHNDEEITDQNPIEAGAVTFEPTNCWQTEVVNILYDLMGKVSIQTYHKMTGGAMSLVMVIFALWLIKRLISQASSFKEESLTEVWTDIIKMFFLCLACGAVASNVNLLVIVLGDFIFPIYNAFLEFAGEILKVSTDETVEGNLKIFDHNFSVFTNQHPVVCAVSKIDFSGDPESFPEGPKQMMNCMICSINHSLSFGMATAMEVMTKTSFLSWLIGFFILACFLFVKLAFVFYLVDTLFRFTVMVVMLPLMFMFYPFPKSRGILGDGIKKMLNSSAFMLFFAVMITMCIQALQLILKTFENVFTSEAAISEFGVPTICMIMIAFLVISSLKIAGQLCDKFVGGKSSASFQKDVKAVVAGVTKGVLSIGTRFLPKSARDKIDNFIDDMSKVGD